MGAFVSHFFIPLQQLPDVHQLPDQCVDQDFPIVSAFSLSGLVQLSFLALAYGAIVCYASNLVAEGSELLLLIPKIAPLVGSVVLPVLGAVPDGAIVLFSGLGPIAEVQKQLSVGVGALAGSTVILLTVPWLFSIVGGRVDISPLTGQAQYRARPKLSTPSLAGSVWHTVGVQPDERATKNAAKMMLCTTVPYLLIQGSAFAFHSQKTEQERSQSEAGYALAGLVVCAVSFFAYLYYHFLGAGEDTVQQDVADRVRERAVRQGVVSLFGVFDDVMRRGSSEGGGEQERFRRVVHHFFGKYDLNGNGSIDVNELGLLMRDLGLDAAANSTAGLLEHFDQDRDGEISFDEFVEVLVRNRATFEQHNVRPDRRSASVSSLPPVATSSSQYGALQEEEHHEAEEEEEEVPEDLAHLPAAEQQRRIVWRSLKMMACGLGIILLFSDALVDVFAELGELLGVSGFYVSFILAPLASNASELIAAYGYALKKTSKTITISLSTLMGAAILNNTFVLGIFLALIKFRGLEWTFSAETIAILAVEVVVGAVVLTRRVHTLAAGALVFALFPASLALVAFLESSWVGLD